MGAALIPVRFAWAILFALLLGVHSLAPTGFMPAFDHGGVTIVACPGATDITAPMHMDGAGHGKASHQTCPYAAASSLAAVGPDGAPALPAALFAVVLLLGALRVVEQRPSCERPPVRGPPIPA